MSSSNDDLEATPEANNSVNDSLYLASKLLEETSFMVQEKIDYLQNSLINNHI